MKSLFVWSHEGSRPPANQAVSSGPDLKPGFASYPRSWWITAWGLVTVLVLSAYASKAVVIPGGGGHDMHRMSH